jgi:dTDP-4-amino-4,6-dideoxygalactose transaminase
MAHLKERGILSVFHYIPLHTAPMGQTYGYRGGELPVTEELSGRLLRLPFFYDLNEAEQLRVIGEIETYLGSRRTEFRPLIGELVRLGA